MQQTSDRRLVAGSKDYRILFHQSLDTLIQLLILPQCAYLKNSRDWVDHFDPKQFRNFIDLAEKQLKQNPQITGDYQYALRKIGRRIDRNMDHYLSDEEIINFVDSKMKEFKRFSFD
ncbi:hypothetical protein L0222_14300 [bacterium]|nr:hypothetical protein [bacterium]MCI0605275.1 hypothetical protein [bacterium]